MPKMPPPLSLSNLALLSFFLVNIALSLRNSEVLNFQATTTVGAASACRNMARNSGGQSYEAPKCSSEVLRISDQLFGPAVRAAESPCPDASWLRDYYMSLHVSRSHEERKFLGISIGCNKGYDAVDFARLGSANGNFTKRAWREASPEQDPREHGSCRQEDAEEITLPTPGGGSSLPRRAEMHCVEPLGANFNMLTTALSKTGWHQDGLIVKRAAISDSNGVIKFPIGVAGFEAGGIKDCYAKQKSVQPFLVEWTGDRTKKPAGLVYIQDQDKYYTKEIKKIPQIKCEDVDAFTLDNYVERFVTPDIPINVLSIDAEGHDLMVLLHGQQRALPRAEYVEFEFHSVGPWAKRDLKEAIDLLDGLGFTCYWAGKKRLFRITSCWLDQYGKHAWSNLACVKRDNYDLAVRMETLFQEQISRARKTKKELLVGTMLSAQGAQSKPKVKVVSRHGKIVE